MDVILDNCSLINIINGDILEEVLNLEGINFHIGPIVYDEFTQYKDGSILDEMISKGLLSRVGEDVVTIEEYRSMLDKYGLGDGETECLCISRKFGYRMASDDKKARSSGIKEIGRNRVIGSIFLLKRLVEKNVFNCSEAFERYVFMKVSGGFLPDYKKDEFC
ncbi:hypothetical protein [Ekhidna sp.]|uniref:hypothetical protein n=1 Tax=Ekhidna sp. TaxID=2608089 RepID=UPI003B5998C5